MNLNPDMLNALRLWLHGTDLAQPTTQSMDETTFDALAFAHANGNDMIQFMDTPEYAVAFQESIVEIIGHTHWFDNPLTTWGF